MKIDLLKLAKQVEETYFKDVDLSFGTVRVYHTPEPMIWTYKLDRPAPTQPIIPMKTATGTQNRMSKPGDKGYEEWLADKESYDDEQADLRLAARYTLALRDIEYPDLSKPPPLAAKYNGHYPDLEVLRKKVWLDHTVFAKDADLAKVQRAMLELAGRPMADDVDEIKKNSESTSVDTNSESPTADAPETTGP